MDKSDFSGKPGGPTRTPAANTVKQAGPASPYNPALALEFFRVAGTPEQFPAGHQLFVENEQTKGFFSKGARIYLLLEGEVALTLKNKPLELVLAGEIFGEIATIGGAPRSATATVRKSCRTLALDEKQFHNSLQQMPEFALMLMSVMVQRLRNSVARLAGTKMTSVAAPVQKDSLDRKMLRELQRALGDPSPTVAGDGQTVITQGAVGACMFVVTQGRIAIAVDGEVIEYVEAGGTFGEMALVDRAGRAATATAETGSTWFLVGRNEFLAMVKSKPAFGIALLRSMSGRVRHLANLLHNLS